MEPPPTESLLQAVKPVVLVLSLSGAQEAHMWMYSPEFKVRM